MTGPTRCRVCAKTVRLRSDATAPAHDDKTGQACPGAGLPPHGDPPCPPSCQAVGTIGWPVPFERTKPNERPKPHASTSVCNSPDHQDQARAWVHGITGHAGVFRTFAEARQERAGAPA